MSLHTKVDPGMAWANPLSRRAGEVQWALTHGVATREDLLAAASLIGAYKQMVMDPREKRQQVVAALREDAR